MVQQDWTNFALQRPNYFPGQYLLDEDFELAHRYLYDRLRYLNSKLHLAGIVEGLEVEAVAGQAQVIIKPGTAIDGEGNLIVVTQEIRRPIPTTGWLCLRYHQEAKVFQQPEVLDSFTRFVETPLLTLEVGRTQDTKTVILAQLTLENGQVKVGLNQRQYSGLHLPTGKAESLVLRSNGDALAITGNLHLSGRLQLSDRSSLSAISDSIEPSNNRSGVVPSEKAVKAHIEQRLAEYLAHLSLLPKSDNSTDASTNPVPSTPQNNILNSWKISEEVEEDGTVTFQFISRQSGVERPRLIIERDSGNVGIGAVSPTRTLEVNGSIRAKHIQSTNPMYHRIYPSDPIVYQDIFEAKTAGAIAKHKSPTGYDETKHATGSEWYDRRVICFGHHTPDESGALITIPEGYDTVWVRVPGDIWYHFKAEFIDQPKEDLGYWTAGRRSANCYCPNGSITDGHSDKHQWLPIPAGRAGKLLITDRAGSNSQHGMWFSGLGFSKNPWAHATQSGVGYHWKVNGGDPTTWHHRVEHRDRRGRVTSIDYRSENWNGDIYTKIEPKTNLELMVPYVWSGRDKLLYMVEHNSDWNGCMHNGITVNGQPIERFLSTYDNPFARHWNSKLYNRYIAARIPAELIPKPTAETPPLLKVKIDMSTQDQYGLNFREMGTHDLELPDPV